MRHPSGSATEHGSTRPWVVDRPRLIERIQDSAAGIVVLFAPAGYGKTTLARQLATASGGFAWYACRPSSADVAKLARGLSAALARACRTDTIALDERLRVTPNPEAEFEALATLVLDALDGVHRPEPFWLIIDDYQWLGGHQTAEEFVAKIASSTALQTLIASRVRPRWVSARSRVYGDCVEIDSRELALMPDEVEQLFDRLGKPIPLQALEIANGWPAVVVLVALTDSATRPALAGALEEFVGSEICGSLSPDVRQTLALLTALPTRDWTTAEAIVGDSALSAAIRTGSHMGVLTKDADGRLDVHPLIAEFLRESREPLSEVLYRKLEHAAVLYLERRDWDEAFEVIEILNHRPLFERLIDEALRVALRDGRSASVKRWIDYATKRDWHAPALDLAAAEIALRDGFYIRAEALSAALAERASALADRTWARLIAGRAAHLAGKEEAALKHFRKARESAEGTDEARVAAWGELTSATDLELPEALTLLDELERSQLADADDQLQLACRRLTVASRFGTLTVLETVREAEQLLPSVDDPLLRTSFLNQTAYVAALSGAYDLALRMLDQMADEARRHRIAFVVPYAQFARAVVYVATRRFREGIELLQRARAEGERTNDSFVVASCAAIHARALISIGAFHEAAAIASYEAARMIKSMRAELIVTRALATVCLGDVEGAIASAHEARDLSQTVEVPTIGACVEAIASSSAGRDAAALAGEAAALARSTRYIDGFITAYRGYPELARLVAAQDEHREWLTRVMLQAEDHDLVKLVGISRPGEAATHLSRREAEVFRLLRQGLSNKQIAQELFITEATAKIHVRHIREKLGAKTRTEAALKGHSDELRDLN